MTERAGNGARGRVPTRSPEQLLPSTAAQREARSAPPFVGTGEMPARCRAFDWAATPLGPVTSWSQSLRTTVGIVMASRNPMFLWWGFDLIQFYNDAYRPSLGDGGRHPRALGARGREFWTDIWDAIGPQIAQVMTGGEATWHEDQYLPIERNGRLEDVWWTYSYSPVYDDDGSIGGTLVVCQETTQRVLAERERARMLDDTARAERRAARVLDQVSDEHLTMDADFRILTVNLAAERALGTPRDALIGHTHWEAFPASVGSEAERQYRRVIAERVEAHFTHHYVGESYDRHLEIDAYPTDEGGIAIFWRDVSERLRAVEALRQSEARLRAIYDGTYEYIGLIAPNGTLLEANRASLEFTGNRREDVVGRPFWDTPWFTRTPGAPEFVREAVARAAGGEFIRYEADLRRPSGEMSTFDISFHPVRDERGDVVLIVPEGRDVTERQRAEAALRESEAKYRTLFDSLDEGFCVIEVIFDERDAPVDYRFLEANPAFVKHTGLVHAVGNRIRDIVPGHEAHWFEIYGRVALTGEPIRFDAPAEALGRWYDVYAFRIGLPEERRVAVLFNDVSAARASAAERDRLLRAAEAANRAKGEFLAIMSHELRTPLNAIGGYAELLEMGIRGPVTPQQAEDLRRIQTSQRHLLGLINEVLNYAKLETGTVHYDITEVLAREALTAAELLVAPQARSKGISLTVSAASPELAVRADAEKLRQILVNLLSNAVKFTDRGGRIELSCTTQGANVLIVVRDSGIGIPTDKLEAIFDPFVQVRADLTRPHEGTGLGLAISRDLARGMGGDLTAASKLGQGSTFTLALPAP